MAEIRERGATSAGGAADEPGAARLYALLIGGLLSVGGVVGFFYDSSFGTGSTLTSDDLAGILLVNGWRNVVYLATGLLALALATVRPRAVALGLSAFYLALGIWGLAETERGLGSILDALPLANRDNALHLLVGGLGMVAFLADGGLPKRPRLEAGPQLAGEPPQALAPAPTPDLDHDERRPRRPADRGGGDRP